MSIIKTDCPACESPLEFPRDFEHVICAKCGTAFQVRDYKGALNLSRKDRALKHPASVEMDEAEALAIVESKLAELDEMISEAGAEIEALRSREQSGPLQMGCSFFGLFVFAIVVIVAFMPLGRRYFGSWMFYVALSVILLLGLRRIRQKQISPAQIEEFRSERLKLENGLAQLEAERERIRNLKSTLIYGDQEPDPESGVA